jgi:hypothetical protein
VAFAFFIYPILTRSLGIGSAERASAEEGMEGFLEIRVTYDRVGIVVGGNRHPRREWSRIDAPIYWYI